MWCSEIQNLHQKTVAFRWIQCIICNILCHEHRKLLSHVKLPVAELLRGNIFSSSSEDKPSGSCCRALQRKYIKTASLKSFQSAPLSLLVEFELQKAEFGPSKSKKPDHLALQAASISRSRCFKIFYFFINSYNNGIHFLKKGKKKSVFHFLPRLRSNTETFHFIMFSKSLMCPWTVGATGCSLALTKGKRHRCEAL